MKLDLLAMAAHPDDVELTCGGTLLKMARSGYKTGILDLTAGEMGTRGTPETRAKEAAKAASFEFRIASTSLTAKAFPILVRRDEGLHHFGVDIVAVELNQLL